MYKRSYQRQYNCDESALKHTRCSYQRYAPTAQSSDIVRSHEQKRPALSALNYCVTCHRSTLIEFNWHCRQRKRVAGQYIWNEFWHVCLIRAQSAGYTTWFVNVVMPCKCKVAYPCVFCDKCCSTDTTECSSCNNQSHRVRAMLTTEEYASFTADRVIYLCPHYMGKTSDGRYDWSVLINRYISLLYVL